MFSAVVITLLGEIIPQAYFSRNALRMTVFFLPFLEFYRIVLLYPLAKPTALLLDWWLGMEGIALSARARCPLIDRAQRRGRRRHRACSKRPARATFSTSTTCRSPTKAKSCDPQSIISLPIENRRCMLPKFNRSPDDPFLRQVDASGKKWVIVTDLNGEPVFVLDAHHFLRDALFDELETPQ